MCFDQDFKLYTRVKREHMHAWFIVENTQLLLQLLRVLPLPKPFVSDAIETKLRKERFDSVRVRTFSLC